MRSECEEERPGPGASQPCARLLRTGVAEPKALDWATSALLALASNHALPDGPSCQRANRLQVTLGLSKLGLRFVLWTAAVGVDVVALRAAEALGASQIRSGLDIADFVSWHDLGSPAARRVVADVTALVKRGLLIAVDPHATAAGNRYRASTALSAWLQGHDEPPAPLRPLETLPWPALSHHDAKDDWNLAQRISTVERMVVTGPAAADVEPRVAVALGLATQTGWVLDLDALTDDEAVAAAQRLGVECLLREHVPVVASRTERPALRSVVATWFRRGRVLCLGAHAAALLDEPPDVQVELRSPTPAGRSALWAQKLPKADADALAARYEIGAAMIRRISSIANHRAGAEQALRDTSRASAGMAATAIRPRRGFADLVLPEDVLEEVRLLIARVAYAHQVLNVWGLTDRLGARGGVVGLLSGPPGTGKTLIAEVVAHSLGVELLQVDVGQATSRWLGETEKNLAQVFVAAETGGAVLLLDEADSLLARRTHVQSTNDRYANMGVNYLLSRLDNFRGIALLTTNLESSLDPALRRRLAAHIVVPQPGLEELQRLWRHMLGPWAERLDLRELAARHPKLTGATVKNAVLRASFRAAAAGRTVELGDLTEAARAEYALLGHGL